MKSEHDIILHGAWAEEAMRLEAFQQLFDIIKQETAQQIVETPLADKQQREELYMTCMGMGFFFNKLNDLRLAKDEQMRSQAATLEKDD